MNGKLATSCTNANLVESIEVTKMVDPMTKKEVYNIPDGYDDETNDDCSYVAPHIGASYDSSGKKFSITVSGSNVKGGTCTVTFADGTSLAAQSISTTAFSIPYTATGNEGSATVTVNDGYNTDTVTVSIPKN